MTMHRKRNPPRHFPTPFDWFLIAVMAALGLAYWLLAPGAARADVHVVLEILNANNDFRLQLTGSAAPADVRFSADRIDHTVPPPTTPSIGTAATNNEGVTANMVTWANTSLPFTSEGDIDGSLTGQHVPKVQWGTFPQITLTRNSATPPVFTGTIPTPPAPIPIVDGYGYVTLNWIPSTQNMDGSPLTNLTGYTVYWGSSLPTNVEVVNDPSATFYQFSIPITAPSTVYFEMDALSATGRSERSNRVQVAFDYIITSTPAPQPPTNVVVTVTATCEAPEGFTCEVQVVQ